MATIKSDKLYKNNIKMISKKLVATKLFILVLTISNVYAQGNIELELRTNFGIGGEYKKLEYDNVNGSGELLFSPGGGVGAEIGLGYLFYKSIVAYSSIGYQQNLALQYHSSASGDTDKTSFSFSRSSILLGAKYRFKFNEEDKLGLQIGGGGSYNIPGKMKITELNVNYGDVTFYPKFGFHIETGLSYSLKKWTLIGSLRYRQLSFRMKDYSQPKKSSLTSENYRQFPDYIKNVNANGVDLSFSITRILNNKAQ